jgi:hypothetical protein
MSILSSNLKGNKELEDLSKMGNNINVDLNEMRHEIFDGIQLAQERTGL